MSAVYLATARVTLHPLTPADEEDLFALDADPEVMRYLTNGVPTAREETRAILPRVIALTESYGGRFGLWAARERASGRFLGWFLFRPSRKDPQNLRRIELGYRLRREFWGKGYATEVSRALIAKGFAELGVEEVYAQTMRSNLGSRRVMEKCGLAFVRELFDPDYPDSPEPDVEYARGP